VNSAEFACGGRAKVAETGSIVRRTSYLFHASARRDPTRLDACFENGRRCGDYSEG